LVIIKDISLQLHPLVNFGRLLPSYYLPGARLVSVADLSAWDIVCKITRSPSKQNGLAAFSKLIGRHPIAAVFYQPQRDAGVHDVAESKWRGRAGQPFALGAPSGRGSRSSCRVNCH